MQKYRTTPSILNPKFEIIDCSTTSMYQCIIHQREGSHGKDCQFVDHNQSVSNRKGTNKYAVPKKLKCIYR
jgi:hypothetical protein